MKVSISALDLFKSFLKGRLLLRESVLWCEVPQGSVLSNILSSLYVKQLARGLWGTEL